MRKSPALLSVLLTSACVDVTINNIERGADDASTSTVVCNLVETDAGALGSVAAPGSDSSTFRPTFRPPRATDSITLRGNLGQTEMTLSWDAKTPKTTSNFTTAVSVYDSVGKAIDEQRLLSRGSSGAADPDLELRYRNRERRKRPGWHHPIRRHLGYHLHRPVGLAILTVTERGKLDAQPAPQAKVAAG
jgi:hypothetical protein